jgi:signal transduction histidine kinase
MRQLLDILRTEQPAERHPQPHLSDLPKLIEAARRAGAHVDLSVPAGDLQVPPAIAIGAYRIIQESLSNANRHAPGAPITVALNRTGTALQLNITNSAPPTGPTATDGAQQQTATLPPGPAQPGTRGHGLAGMRERATILGGSLTAGPTPDGGFAVSAVLPLNGAP